MIPYKIKIKIERLHNGESFITSEAGNSMTPILKSKEPTWISPVESWENCEIGDIVFCKVRGSYVTHLVHGKNEKRGLLIGNNHGHMNGWTKTVFGKVRPLSKEELETLNNKEDDNREINTKVSD
jgi:hypothetical protein